MHLPVEECQHVCNEKRTLREFLETCDLRHIPTRVPTLFPYSLLVFTFAQFCGAQPQKMVWL